MSIVDRVLGRPLSSTEGEHEELSALTGVPVLGLDGLASTGYGPEAALTVLLPLGLAGQRYFFLITVAVVVQLASLYFSYRQTQAAYPNGGGAYLVIKDNLGIGAGVCAAVALLVDYLLNVSVAIAAGVGAVVSALPGLQPYTLGICLAVLGLLTVVNLRGVRETGLTFIGPVFLFVACLSTVIVVGILRTLRSGGHPEPVVAPPPLPAPTAVPGTWLLLAAFANGLTAMTGVEAVSNAVPIFREPKVQNAHRALTAIALILGLFLLGIGYLCPAYAIGAMSEREPGYQTIFSQLVGAVFGRGIFYFVSLGSIFAVLTFSAQTSFADFPRVCRFLADDRFLPRGYAKRGRRLVFSNGIVVLSLLSGMLLLAFRGVTDALIPLFAVGAFTAFFLSQIGMVVHWARRGPRRSWLSLAYNAAGALTTGVALCIIVLTKFAAGAWLVLVVGPGLVVLLRRIRRHYDRLNCEIDAPLSIPDAAAEPPVAIVPIESWNRPAEKALHVALSLTTDVIALHIATEGVDTERLRGLWAEKVEAATAGSGRATKPVRPRLEVLPSPYRKVLEPMIEYVRRTEQTNPGRIVALILPELASAHWYEDALHNVEEAALKTLLDTRCTAQTIVVYVPWHLKDG